MKVRRFDNILRYHVESRSRRGLEHLVELDTYRGNGACTCEHFRFGCEPLLKKGAPASDRTRCEHLKRARQKLVDDVIAQVAANEKAKAEEKAKARRR